MPISGFTLVHWGALGRKTKFSPNIWSGNPRHIEDQKSQRPEGLRFTNPAANAASAMRQLLQPSSLGRQPEGAVLDEKVPFRLQLRSSPAIAFMAWAVVQSGSPTKLERAHRNLPSRAQSHGNAARVAPAFAVALEIPVRAAQARPSWTKSPSKAFMTRDLF